MNEEKVSIRFSDKTRCLEIEKLERESHKFLYIGFIGAILFIGALEPFVTYKEYTYVIDTRATYKPIRVELITIPPIQERREAEQVIIDESKIIELPVIELADTLVEQIYEEPAENPFKQFTPYRKFPALGVHPEIPVQDTIRPPKGMILFPKPSQEPEKKLTIPVEDIKDERRRFRTDIFGIGVGGIGTLPIHLGRHAAKSIVWKVQDTRKKRKMEELRKKNFTVITEKELKFMILIWRDGLLEPFKLTQHDRSFLAESKSDEIMTNNKYLDKMEKRGLVSSILVSGQIVYRTNFSRLEILQSFIKAFINIDEYNEKDTIIKYIELINRCYDIFNNRVVIPK